MNKLRLFICVAIFMSVILSSCQSGKETLGKDSKAVDTTAEVTETSRANIPDNLPPLDFEGETITIHVRGDEDSLSEVYTDIMTGSIVNDAIYERNMKVEERLNVKIEVFAAEVWERYDSSITQLKASIAAGDEAFDIVAGWSARIPLISMEGLLYNLIGLNYLDLDQPWWNQSCNEELLIAGKLYFITGDIAKSYLSAMQMYLFNKKLAEDNKVENLYDVVREYRWTIDYVDRLIKDMYHDFNGNGEVDSGDSFGLVTATWNYADAYMQSFRISMMSRDENGMPVLNVDEERMASCVEKVYNLLWGNQGCTTDTDGGPQFEIFIGDRALLTTVRVMELESTFNQMESDYGVLPFPMFDENQKQYGTRIQDALSIWCIPVDIKKPEISAAVLEALAAESYRKVTPAYYDVVLKNRYSRDEDTAEMIDLIRSSALINFESIFNEAIGNPWFVMRNLINEKKNNFASYWASNKKVVETQLKKVVEEIQKIS
jgi:ABC-type glycerol-3-phosphate transport system substrate-binding protein